ncbi:MAG: hypothetical protein JW967_03780 [Dehalococcoidales bacterium]|nr:hypothetical protein [Dehalococcoidales bacterium]
MVRLTFYGGLNEIGTNKILLEDQDKTLLLDFCLSYKKHGLFFEEYLKPRSGSGLLEIVDEIKPEVAIPIHTENAEIYQTKLTAQKIAVTLLDESETISV